MNFTTDRIPAIVLHQPYATLVGIKEHETRHWKTSYRGDILICAGKFKSDDMEDYFEDFKFQYFDDDVHHPSFLCGDEELPSFLDCAYYELPFGAVVSVAFLAECHLMISMSFVLTVLRLQQFKFLGLMLTIMPIRIIQLISDRELHCGLWKPGRYAWQLENVRRLKQPVPIRGQQGIWTPDEQLCNQVYEQIEEICLPVKQV